MSSHSVSQSSCLELLLWAQECVGAGLVGAAQGTPQMGKEVALQGSGVETQLHYSQLVNLIQLLLPNYSVVWCLISFVLAFTGKVIPVQRCLTATLSARSDMSVWHEDRFPVLIHEKVGSLSAFWRRGVSRPTNGTLVSGWTGSYHSKQQLHTCISCQQSGKN